MKKRLLVVLSIIVTFVLLFSANSSVLAATKHTVDESMNWLDGKVGTKVGSGQCVALIQSYYSYLGVSSVSGNACDYATNSLPSGWSRVKGGVPQKGDILVYTGAKYGHVAIYAGGTVSYHQNMAGQYVEKKTNWAYNKSWYSNAEGGTKSYWGYIRPNWKESAPDKPAISFSNQDTDCITITWGDVSGAKKYDLQFHIAGEDYTTVLSNTTKTSYTQTGLTAGKRYWYKVIAKNDNGSTTSDAKASYTKAKAPTLSKTVGVPTSMTLKWSKPTDAASYVIRRRRYDESDFKDIKTISNGDTTTYVDTGLNPGYQYVYYIHATCKYTDSNGKNNSWTCNSKSSKNYTLLNAVNVSATSPYSINLSWDAPHGDKSVRYDIQRSFDNVDENYRVIATVDGNTKSYGDTNLTPNTRYYYRVVAMSDSYCTQTLTNSAVTNSLPDPSNIALSNNNITIKAGDSYKLYATVSPDNANDKSVTWTSGNSNIASVAWDGTVTAIKEGSTNIYAKTVNGCEAVCNVTVQRKYILADLGDDFTAYIQYSENGKYVTREENSDVKLYSYNGAPSQLWHFIKRNDGSYKILSTAKDDFNVLDVTAWGTDTGTNVGTYYDNDYNDEYSSSNQSWYILQSKNGYRLKAQCSDCVMDVSGGGDAADGTNIQMWEYLEYGAQEFYINKVIPVTGVSLDSSDMWLGINVTAPINARIQPQNATNQSVTWSSSDEAVATVENGMITAKGVGTTVITVTTEDGLYTASCDLSVILMPESISLDKTSLKLNGIGKSATLQATVTPENADKTVTWESSDPSIATVTSAGKVTAKGLGSATITATTLNGETAQCTVKVRELIINKTSLSLNVGEYDTLTVQTNPAIVSAAVVGGTKPITWTSSNTGVATALSDSTGYNARITAKAAGQAIITAKTHDGFEVSCTVNVTGTGTTLEAPKITSIDDTSKTEITVKWSEVLGATSYRVDKRKSGDSEYTTVKQGISFTQFTDTGLEVGERYYYRVYAINSNQTSKASATVGGSTKSDEPNISSQSTSEIELTWSSIENAENYTVRRRKYDGEYEDIATVTETSYKDTSLESGTKYYYWIQANCKTTSEQYVVKSATNGQFTKPIAPTVTAEDDTVKIQWQQANGKGTYTYRIMRKAASEQEYTELATVSDLEYIDDSIEAETVYYYYIDVLSNNDLCISSDVSSTDKTATIIGDVNGDGAIDIADALLVMKHDAGLTMIDNAFQQAADVNNDGEIDIADAILIMKYDAGLINSFN